MSEYTAARSRTRAKIERAFWDLYLEKNSGALPYRKSYSAPEFIVPLSIFIFRQ